jgi:hypothetical protein
VSAGGAAAAAARIVFGVLGPTLGSVAAHLRRDPARARHWGERFGVDLTKGDVVADAMLRVALRRNPNGVVLVGSANRDHLLVAARAAERPAAIPDLLDGLPALLAEAASSTGAEAR